MAADDLLDVDAEGMVEMKCSWVTTAHKKDPGFLVACHFNTPPCSLANIFVSGLLQCSSKTRCNLEEQHLIFRLGSLQTSRLNIEACQTCWYLQHWLFILDLASSVTLGPSLKAALPAEGVGGHRRRPFSVGSRRTT
eukprot:g38881.t1